MKEQETNPFGYILSCDFFLSPKTQIALSDLHRLQGEDPSHYKAVSLAAKKRDGLDGDGLL